MSKERAVQLRLAGFSRRQIAESLGVKTGGGALSRWLKDVPAPEWTKRPNAKDDLREIAIAMRKEGKSYREIQEFVAVSTSTLSLWLRDVLVDDAARSRLEDRARAGRLNAAAALRARREAKEERLIREASSQIPLRLEESDLFVAGLVAYWAEGGKAKPWNVSQGVSFINSDVNMIRLCLAWLRLLGIDDDRLLYRVYLHESADPGRAVAWWSEQLGADAARFSRTSLKHHERRIRRLPSEDYHGCLRIDVRRSTDLNRQIAGWWHGLVAAAVSVEGDQSGMV